MISATKTITGPQDMITMVNELGFLPFFANGIPGFSIAEHTPPELWFSDDVDGPWEWKGPVIVDGGFAYGKFLQGKAMYVSMEWFPHLANYRRSKHEITSDEKQVLDVLKQYKSLLTTQLRKLCGYSKPRVHVERNPLLRLSNKETATLLDKKKKRTGRESLATVLTKLQMATRIVIADFEYKHDHDGNQYGWGVARYCTPEDFFGVDDIAATCTPSESFDVLVKHLHAVLPEASEKEILKIID